VPAADRFELRDPVVRHVGRLAVEKSEVEAGVVAIGFRGLAREVWMIGRHHMRTVGSEPFGDLPSKWTARGFVPDDHAGAEQQAGHRSEAFLLANRRHATPVSVSGRQALQGPVGGMTAHTVGVQPDVLLKVVNSPVGVGSEDAIDATGIEAEAAQPLLKLGNVVAAQIGSSEVQVAVTHLPSGLNECLPGRFVARSGNR
jgi:hypothetical protein